MGRDDLSKVKNNIPLPILILICAVLLFAMYLSLSTLALAIWGDSVMGTVDSYQARLDDTDAGQNRSRTVSKGYWFMANGKDYRGYVMYQSDEAWPKLDEGETRSERIRYLDIFPYINKPAALCEFDDMGEVALIYHILSPSGCLLLLLLVIRTSRGKKKKKIADRKPAAPSAPTQGSNGLVGFSDRYNCPEILVTAQKNKKSSIGCMWILVFVPLIGFPVAGLLMHDFPFGESLVIGIGIAVVMLVINLFALRRTKQPMWEGVVVNKYSKEKSEHRGGEDDNYRTYTEYTTIINTDTGKKKTIVEKDSWRHMYDYLAVGDRVRFHPKFGTYEKYNKSKDRIIYCNVCSMMNPIQNDRCNRCNNLLFK